MGSSLDLSLDRGGDARDVREGRRGCPERVSPGTTGSVLSIAASIADGVAEGLDAGGGFGRPRRGVDLQRV